LSFLSLVILLSVIPQFIAFDYLLVSSTSWFLQTYFIMKKTNSKYFPFKNIKFKDFKADLKEQEAR
jgi:hypothetical protein